MVRKFLLMMDRHLTEKKMIISRAKKIKAKKQNTDLNKKTEYRHEKWIYIE